MEKGIISCGLKIDDSYDRDIKIGDVIYIERGKKYEFYLTPDKKYFDTKNTDLSSLIKKAKWAYIMNSFFDTALKKKKGELYSEWGTFNKNRGETPIPYLGIGNQYKQGSSIEFQYDNSTSLWIGTGYRVEAFNEVPNDGLYFTIVPYIEKYLRHAFFEAPSNEIKMEQGKVNDGLLSYGAETFVEVSLHRFGNSKLDNNTRPQDYNVELYLCDGDGNVLEKEAFLTESLSKYVTSPNTGDLNNSFRVRFNIYDSWKDKYHVGKDYKKYSLEVHIVNTKENNYQSFNIAQKNYSIIGNSGDDEHNVEYLTQTFFIVKKSALDIIHLTQNERTNMIQYIGDVDYNYREFDPCGYSKISIKELSNKDRPTPFVIFEEGKDNSVADNTRSFYDIITGDDIEKAKKIEIKVEGLTVKELLCQGILLDEDKKHKDLHNVFQTGRIWTAKPIKIWSDKVETRQEPDRAVIDKLRIKNNPPPIILNQKTPPLPKQADNNYENQEVLYKKDETHKGETGVLDSDYDQVADRKIEGAGMLGWKENEDFVIKNGGEFATFTLQKVVYVYDKKITDAPSVSQTYSATEGLVDKTIDSFWVLNYFWISESLAQVYFLPISTCRYPNQVAKIRVYPDITWSLAFTFSLKNPLAFTHSNQEAGRIFKEAQDKARKSGYDRYRLSQGGTVPDEFSLSLKARRNKIEGTNPPMYGVEEEFALKYAKKISDFMGVLLKIKELADKVKNTARGGVKAAVPGMPFSFEVMSPKLGVAVDWKGELVENKFSTTGLLKFTADPLVGAELTIDMLGVASNMHPVLKVINKTLEVGLDALGGYMKLEAKFYGQLNITIEALKINTITGISAGSKPVMIMGKMGVNILFQLKVQGKLEAFGLEPIDISFNAEAKVDSYFGGTSLINFDDKGVYADITGKFSGLLLTLKVEVKIGKYTRKININNEPIFPSDTIPLGKHYIIE